MPSFTVYLRLVINLSITFFSELVFYSCTNQTSSLFSLLSQRTVSPQGGNRPLRWKQTIPYSAPQGAFLLPS